MSDAPIDIAALGEEPEMDLDIAANNFKLLSDATRLKVIHLLCVKGERNVTELCTDVGQSQPAVSHHLSLLRMAGFIESRRDGKHNFYSISRTGKAMLNQMGALLMLKGSSSQGQQ